MKKKLHPAVVNQIGYLNYLIKQNKITTENLISIKKSGIENNYLTDKQRKKMTIESKKVELAISECKK